MRKQRFFTLLSLLGFLLYALQPLPALAAKLTEEDVRSIIYETTFYQDGETAEGCSPGSASSVVALTGNDNQQKAFNYFLAKGLTDFQSAGIVGNLIQESSVSPTAIQGGGQSNNPADAGSGGWGLAQWTPGSKIIATAKELGITTPIHELGTQLAIIFGQMQNTSPPGVHNMLPGLKNTKTLEEAVRYFEEKFEAAGEPNFPNRIMFAKSVLEKYGSGEGAITGSEASCGTTGAVDCEGGSSTTSLSQVRQNVVCIAEAEMAKWDSGAMKPGTDFYTYSQGRNEEWCADFASWVFNKAQYPISLSAKDGNVAAVASIKSIGQEGTRFEYHAAGSYTPVPGDIVVYQEGISHVDIVVSVNTNKNTMVTIGGNEEGTSTANTSSRVARDTLSGFTGNQITGYVSPKE